MENKLFELIKKDHKETKDVFSQIEELADRSSQKRADLFAKMKEELVPHMKAEEKVFYAVLLEDEKSKEDAMEGMEEHHASELILKELSNMSPREDYWPAKFSVFKEMVEHHIEEEESTIFQVAEEVIPHEQLETIADEFEQAKEKIKGKTPIKSSK